MFLLIFSFVNLLQVVSIIQDSDAIIIIIIIIRLHVDY
jgi:hypothetical protein